jgi:predicted AAA+ superfamily ATPase
VYFNRIITDSILKTGETFPVILVTGPRQVGKSTVLERIKEPQRTYVTLDDPQIRTLAQTDPALFLQTYEPPVLIDEVQYAPQLFPYIKMIVDKRKEKGLFWLTGSQPFQLMKNVSESLAGRVGILEMQGHSFPVASIGRADFPDFSQSSCRTNRAIAQLYRYCQRRWRFGSYGKSMDFAPDDFGFDLSFATLS